MKIAILSLIVLFALGLAGCDKRPTDAPKPKTASLAVGLPA